VATTVASDWLANELAEYGEIDAACHDKYVMHLMTAIVTGPAMDMPNPQNEYAPPYALVSGA